MANKRNLKQVINYVCSDLFAEGVALSMYGASENKETVDAILVSLLKTHKDFISRISHPEPGMKAKVYYRQLLLDFDKRINEIVDQLNAAH